MEKLPLVGLIEIAMRAGVRRPVVSMWRTRYTNFPEPVSTLSVGPIFWWPEIERWLIATGRDPHVNKTREEILVPWRSQQRLSQLRPEAGNG